HGCRNQKANGAKARPGAVKTKTLRYYFLATFLAGPVIAAAQTATKPAAIVNGQTITEGQVATAAAKDLKKLGTDGSQSQRSAAMGKALNEMIAERILTAETKKADKTKAELIKSKINSDLPPPPAQVVETYYEFNKSRFPGPRAKAIEQVREY